MTAPLLLALISAALLCQLAAGIAVALARSRGVPGETAPVPDPDTARPGDRAWVGWREFRVVHREFEDASHGQCSFHLEPVDGVPLTPYRPGQFVTIRWPAPATGTGTSNASDGPRMLTRCYSLSDRPDAARFRITVKRALAPADRPDAPPGVVSHQLLDHVRVGDTLQFQAPAGAFFLDTASTLPAVFIAGGVGITPMLSMLLWSLHEQPERPIHLFYGVRHGGEHAFKRVLEALAAAHEQFHLTVAYSDPGPADRPGNDFQHSGRIDAGLLRRTLPEGPHQYYVCGPAPMMGSLVPAIVDSGVPRQDVRTEAFGPASLGIAQSPGPALPLETPVEVRFRRSGRTLTWDAGDGSLLDFAEAHAVAVEAGCRSGSCGSCETAIVSGSVRYLATPAFAVAARHCLLCVATPATALVLDA